jgi:glycosyltransferase involved in cell wall biosynthesis
MKIALLTKYGALSASTRQRFQQYGPYLSAAGFDLDPHPLFDDQYLKQLYERGSRNPGHIALRYLQRLHWLVTARDADVIWLHCELFPFLPGVIELLSRLPGKPIVFDYDDAVFHNYDLHPNPIVRAVLAQKLQASIGGAQISFCGNEYLAEYARPLCNRVEVIPTVVDIENYRPASSLEPKGMLRIGWIGTPSTWNKYMEPKLDVCAAAAKKVDGRLTVMGAGPLAALHPSVDFLPWSETTEIACIQSMNIGVMPLDESPWARGKCGYKLIQYMACGLPVVASPVGVNSRLVEHGVNGFLAETDAQWAAALDALLGDASLRRRMGAAGRKKVEQEYSLQVFGPRVADLLIEVACAGRPSKR